MWSGARSVRMASLLRTPFTTLIPLQKNFLDSLRFPGSQPVSFGTRDLDRLEKQECVQSYPFSALVRSVPLNRVDPGILFSGPHQYHSYWVCEKSDGIRVLFVVLTNPEGNQQLVHIVCLFL